MGLRGCHPDQTDAVPFGATARVGRDQFTCRVSDFSFRLSPGILFSFPAECVLSEPAIVRLVGARRSSAPLDAHLRTVTGAASGRFLLLLFIRGTMTIMVSPLRHLLGGSVNLIISPRLRDLTVIDLDALGLYSGFFH